MPELTEGDVFALLTDVRDGLRRDGYELDIVTAIPRVHLRIRAGENVCEDCLVAKETMVRYVVIALRDLSRDITRDDVHIDYPNELDVMEGVS